MNSVRKLNYRRKIVTYRKSGRSMSEDHTWRSNDVEPLSPETLLLKCETIESKARSVNTSIGGGRLPLPTQLPKLCESTQL